jgi:hypothetical protein
MAHYLDGEVSNTSKSKKLQMKYEGVLISLWLFLFSAHSKEFFFDGLKKSEQ